MFVYLQFYIVRVRGTKTGNERVFDSKAKTMTLLNWLNAAMWLVCMQFSSKGVLYLVLKVFSKLMEMSEFLVISWMSSMPNQLFSLKAPKIFFKLKFPMIIRITQQNILHSFNSYRLKKDKHDYWLNSNKICTFNACIQWLITYINIS